MARRPERRAPQMWNGLMNQRHILLFSVNVFLLACWPGQAELQSELKPLQNLLGARFERVSSGPGVQIQHDADRAGLSARFAPGSTAGCVRLGPVSLPSGTGVLRFTGALSLIGDSTCSMKVIFSSRGVASEPVNVLFSGHAARVGDVFQDVFVPVPSAVDGATIEMHLKKVGGDVPALRLRYPCLIALRVPAARPPAEDAVLFRQAFSEPDGRADVVGKDTATFPAWSCVLPTAAGKSGPGLRATRAQHAALFALPDQQELVVRGSVSFWLKPLWDQGDARPADMVKLTRGGRGMALIRKNHGWSFLFVVWDRENKTHGVSCDLRYLVRDQWTKIEGVWDAGKGLRLIVNGVVLGKKEGTWPVESVGAVALRVGQGEHDKKEPAPYVLDEIEVLRTIEAEAFQE